MSTTKTKTIDVAEVKDKYSWSELKQRLAS